MRSGNETSGERHGLKRWRVLKEHEGLNFSPLILAAHNLDFPQLRNFHFKIQDFKLSKLWFPHLQNKSAVSGIWLIWLL